MSKNRKFLISEEKFKSDFESLMSFFTYHVQKHDISLKLSDIQDLGVKLEVRKEKEVKDLNVKSVPINTIIFSSSKKSRNIHNLMWYMRCLPCHAENIEEVDVDDVKCYQIQNLKTGRLKGLVSCEVWSQFIEKLTNKIAEL